VDARKNDTNTKDREKIEEFEELDTQSLIVSYDELRKTLKTSTETTLNHIDKLIQGSSQKSNKRLYLDLFRALIVDSARSSESLFYLFEYVTDLRTSMLMLSMEIEKTRGKTTKQVKTIKTKIDQLLNSPAMIEIGKVLQNMQRLNEQRKNTITKNPSKDYLR
jgi:hypothetical protein